MGSKVGADLYLAWRAAVVQPLRKLLHRRPQGENDFLANYATEGLVPTTPHDKAMLAAAGRCISCGLCDELDGQLGRIARGEYQGASILPRQYARSSVEIGYAREALEAIDPEAYRAGEAVCPTRVPLVGLAVWLRERLARTLAFEGLPQKCAAQPAPPADGCRSSTPAVGSDERPA